MSFHGKLQNWLAALSFLALAASVLAAEPPAAKPPAEKPKAKTPAKPRVLVTISKETTYITEPLRPDGYPDYLAALNQRFSRGVTPENNAAVLFWKRWGRASIDEECRERYFQMLGIPPLPEKGDYFVDLERLCPAEGRCRKKPGVAARRDSSATNGTVWTSAMKRPWSKQEFPVLADWLAANEKPLALLVEASKRPRRYDPMSLACRAMMVILLHVWDDMPTVFSLDIPDDGSSDWPLRNASCPRMLRLARWQDRRGLGRICWHAIGLHGSLGKGRCGSRPLSLMTIEGMACAGDQTLLHAPTLRRPRSRTCVRTWQSCRRCRKWRTGSTRASGLEFSTPLRRSPGRA